MSTEVEYARAEIRRARRIASRTPVQLLPSSRERKMGGPVSGASKVGRSRKELDETTFEGKFAMRLRTFMAKANIDANELAKRCAVSRAAVDHWLAGRRTPQVETLPAIAEALGVNSPRTLLPQ